MDFPLRDRVCAGVQKGAEHLLLGQGLGRHQPDAVRSVCLNGVWERDQVHVLARARHLLLREVR